jgi:hypothetical protein
VVAALLVAAIAVVAALAVGPSREAIARFLGVKSSTIEVVPAGSIPTPVPAATSAAGGAPSLPAPLATIATPVPLGAMGAAAGFEARVPPGRGQPLASYVIALGSDRVVLLQFDGFDLWETRLAQEATFGKAIPPGSVYEDLSVRGNAAVWLSGATHYVYYRDSRGALIRESERTVERSTLIWRTDYAFYRIETGLSRDEAVRIAETLP